MIINKQSRKHLMLWSWNHFYKHNENKGNYDLKLGCLNPKKTKVLL